MRKIVIDARMCGPKGHGIALYVEELAQAFAAGHFNTTGFTPFFLLPQNCPSNHALRQFPHQESAIPFLHPREIFLLRQEIAALQPQRFLSPSFSALFSYPCPYAMVLHDLNHLHYGSLAKKIYYHAFVKRAALAAERLFTVSECMQKEIAAWLDLPASTLHVAPNALSMPRVEKANLQALGLEKQKYFLALNSTKFHKNLGTLLQGYRLYRQEEQTPWPLVLSHKPEESFPGIEAVESFSYSQLMGLLADAAALFTPSLYEGFGRAPAEAILLGTSSVASSIPAHLEVLAGMHGCSFVAANSAESWKLLFQRAQKGQLPKATANDSQRLRERYSLHALTRPFQDWLQDVAKA